MITNNLNLMKGERHFLAHGGGMLAVCSTVGTLLALRAAGICLTTFATFTGKSGGLFPLVLLAAGHSLEEIVRIFVTRSFTKVFLFKHSAPAVIAFCRTSFHSLDTALGKAMYDCTGLRDFWKDLVHDFPEKVCIPAVSHDGNATFLFTGWSGSHVHFKDGGYEQLDGPPRDIVPVCHAGISIPAVMAAPHCRDVVRSTLGDQAVKKLPCPDQYMLDGGLSRNLLAILAKHCSIKPEAVIACSADGPYAQKERKQYQRYTAMLPVKALPRLELYEQVEGQDGWLFELIIRKLRALDFDASSELKLGSTFDAMDEALEQLSRIMDVPPRAEIEEEQRRIALAVNCRPTRTA